MTTLTTTDVQQQPTAQAGAQPQVKPRRGRHRAPGVLDRLLGRAVDPARHQHVSNR